MVDGPVLGAVGRWLGRRVELSRIVGEAVEAVAAAMDAERGTFFLVEPGTGQLVSVAGHFPEVPQIRLGAGQGIAGHVVRTGEALILPQVEDDPRFCSAVDAASGYRTRSMVCVPVRAGDERGRILGALQVLNKRGVFGEDDAARLRGLAHQLAMVLEATSLLGRLESSRPGPLHGRFDGVVGESPAAWALRDQLGFIGPRAGHVLVLGRSGTGKELA
ncbi:MAG: GAF domain-containing protein, partial [Myxococcales bacterium]|nr:GAF domain-containing protein [Myxococcales bacterium]